MSTAPITITLQAAEAAFTDGYSESLTVAARKEIPLEDFAWPEERKFPCDTQEHVDACAKLLGHAPENKQAEIKARAIRIAKRHGFSIPESWKAEEKESLAGFGRALMESARPAKKIGTLPICWLEYGARSLNGRIYPPATCDAIFAAAERKLADPNALPPTTFVSHEAANGNVNTQLVGGPTKVWQEGSKFWANIDLADMSVARDMLGLAEGGYLRSGSMRVLGVVVQHDRNYDLPLVVPQETAEQIEFLGIDLTTRPGLDKVARIPQVLYEADGREPYTESFNFELLPPEKEVPPAMGTPLFIQVALGALQEARSSREGHMHVHDHLAGVMDEVFGPKHGSESARYHSLIEGQLDEAGKAIAMKHATRLAAAHDESARQLGMKCEGAYGDVMPNAPSDTDNDGDNPAAGNDPDNDGESAHQKEKPLTEEEMIAELKKKGFAVEAPKSAEQKKLEALEALIAEQNAKIAALAETGPTQRQTQANPSQFEESSTLVAESLYQEGDLMRGDLATKNWKALSDRRVPWPHDKIDPSQALHELAPFMAFRLNTQEAAAHGRDISSYIGANEEL
jgi:hypothetical protein